MAILTNPFVKVVNEMNGIPTAVTGLTDAPALNARFKAREASLYVTMHQVMAQVEDLLAPGEQLLSMMPMTNEENSGYATDGVMGMYAARTVRAKQYIKEQSSLRGNRLMLFTDRRMLFFIVIEFLDDPTAYYSYEYSDLKKIAIKKHRMSVPGDKFWQREHFTWYTIDFETPDRHVFNEVLTNANGKQFLQNLVTIPGMRQIEVVDCHSRPRALDNYLSSGKLWFGVALSMIGLGLLLAALTWLLEVL